MDKLPKNQRSEVMRKVKGKNTKLEYQVIEILLSHGIKRFKVHQPGILGSPDIVLLKEKIVIFIDSCFWHGCPKHLRMPKTNQKYWNSKIGKNVIRDIRIRAKLRRQGWSVLRIWEHDVRNPLKVVRKITRTLNLIKNKK